MRTLCLCGALLVGLASGCVEPSAPVDAPAKTPSSARLPRVGAALHTPATATRFALVAAVQRAAARAYWPRAGEPGTLVAANAPHGFALRFDRGGVTLRSQRGFSLRLSRAWLSGARCAPGSKRASWSSRVGPRAASSRVSYRGAALSEWYVNGPLGLEQGFTLHRAPARGCTALEVPVSTTLRAELRGQRVVFVDGDGRTLARYTALYVHDASGRRLPARLAFAATPSAVTSAAPAATRRFRIRIELDLRGARYPVTVDPLVVDETIAQHFPDLTSARLGSSVAIDGAVAVVGAPMEASGGKIHGAAYVFELGKSGWVNTARLVPGTPEDYQEFGFAVAVSGSTIAVGAPKTGTNDRGAVFVFANNAGVWSASGAPLTQPSAPQFALLGAAVALDGDTLAAGAPGSLGSGSTAGAVYVYRRTIGWGLEGTLSPAGLALGDNFGAAVALSGDSVIAGAPSTRVAGQPQGAAYVLTRSGSTWSLQQTLRDGSSAAQFGGAVDIDSDTAVIGAHKHNTGGSVTPGAAFVFARSGSTWTRTAQLLSTTPTNNAHFGIGVAISGTLAAVASSGVGTYNVEVFSNSGGWTSTGLLAPKNNSGLFGVNVAMSGTTLIGGAPQTALAGKNSGAAFVFAASKGSGSEQATLIAADGGEAFGHAVAVAGDFAAVSANVVGQGGAVHVYQWTSTGGWLQVQRLTAPQPAADDGFGTLPTKGASATRRYVTIAMHDRLLVVGAAGLGEAYVYERTVNAPRYVLLDTLKTSNAGAADSFGVAVALDGDWVIVGAPDKAVGASTNAGAAYLFERSGSQWVERRELVRATSETNRHFGAAVALSGNDALVGSSPVGSPPLVGDVEHFVRGSTGAWSRAGVLAIPNMRQDWFYGRAIAIDGDTAAVSAPTGGTSGAGEVYIFTRAPGASFSHSTTLKVPSFGTPTAASFGIALSLDGDAILVGASSLDTRGSGAGGAYLFARSGTTWSRRYTFYASDAAPSQFFGSAVALRGKRAAIGATAGKAYLYTLTVKLRGETCSAATDCLNQTCADGVCCDVTCSGCSACALVGTVGTCTPRPWGSSTSSCKSTNACDGEGACKLAIGGACTSDTDCIAHSAQAADPLQPGKAGRCIDGFCCGADTCDATCKSCGVAGSEGSCSNLPRLSEDLASKPPCTGTQRCNADGKCRAANAEKCKADDECASGICKDGVCCDTACDRDCESCNQAGKVGTCTAIPKNTDPDSDCIGSNPICGGLCNGDAQKPGCEFPGAGTSCGTCRACDGTGRCAVAPQDDPACGVIDCDGLDSKCKDYDDLKSRRCLSFGRCKPPNTAASCTVVTSVCPDGGAPGGDGGGASSDGGGAGKDAGATADSGGGGADSGGGDGGESSGCLVAGNARGDGGAATTTLVLGALALLALGGLRRRARRRRRPRRRARARRR